VSCVRLLLWFSPPITTSPRTQRKAGVFELSRNLPIYKFRNLPIDLQGYLELVTVCQFVNSLFRSLGSVELGFVSEEDLEEGEEIEL
jgi:hypothetical protein